VEGAELRRPLGISIVGGLVVSQGLTLYVTFVVYLYLEKIRVSVNRRRGHTVADEAVPGDRATHTEVSARRV
jgi:multidrug efflux pump